MFNIFSKKQEPCKECKKVKLGELYSIGSIWEAFEKILRITNQALPQGKGGYDYTYIADRCCIPRDITKDVLNVLVDCGVYEIDDYGQYSIVCK